jgi:tetratricopeptide (TPR) repeat protein
MRQTICLAMIVKNEARIISRCLDSVRPIIDSWSIVDTGSEDRTVEEAMDAMRGLNGQIHRRPWTDFATNRTECLELARSSGCDYLLVMDADDTLVIPEGFEWPSLEASAYELQLRSGDVSWWRAQLFRAQDPWRYEFEVHEYATGGGAIAQLHGPWIRIGHDGARRAGGEEAAYRADADVLCNVIAKRPQDARAWFYLGESYRFSGQPEAAINAYSRRVGLGGWDEERWWAQFQIGKLWEQILEGWADASSEMAIEAYDAAYRIRPTRAEPLVACASLLRRKGRAGEAFMRACTAARLPVPKDRWLIDDSCYVWRARDEFSLAAHQLGLHADAAETTMKLIADPRVPPQEHERLITNLGFYRKAMRPLP